MYLALDIQYAAVHGEGFLMSGELAEKLLHVIEPIQLGYGATVRAFSDPQVPRLTSARSSPSLEPSTGVSNGVDTAVTKVIPDTPSALSQPRSLGPRYSSQLKLA